MLNRIRSSLFLGSRPGLEDAEPPQKEVRRRPNKLSKPPTNRSSNSLLSRRAFEDPEEIESPVTEPDQVFPLAEIVNESAGERRSRQDVRQSLKTELFSPRVDDSSIVPQDDNYSWNGSRANLVSLGPIQRRQPDRSSTLLLPSVAERPAAGPRRYSAITSSEVTKHFPVVESPAEAPLNPVVGEVFGSTDSLALHAGVRRRSSGAMCMPMRRRSLQTPGVATRMSKESLSVQEDVRDGYFGRTSFDKEATPSVIEERTEAETPETESLDLRRSIQRPGSRAATPSDLEYPNLGGLRSLRVTNGRPSPTPSDVTSIASRMRSASNGASSRLSSANTFDSISTTRLSSGESNSTISAGTARQAHLQRPQEVQLSSMTTAHSTIVTSSGTKPITQVSIHAPQAHTSITTTTVMNGKDGAVSSSVQSKKGSTYPECYSTGSCELQSTTHHRMTEWADDFSQPLRPASPNLAGLNTTSKTTEFDDNLFEDEQWKTLQDEAAARVEEDEQLTTFQKLPQSSGDSGYNSEASARASAEDNSASEDYSPFASADTTPIEEGSYHEAALAARIQKEFETKKGNRPSYLASFLNRKGFSAPSVPRVSDFAASANSLGSSNSNQSNSSAELTTPKKLKKRQDSTRPTVTVQGYRELAQAHIPPIPSEIAANLAKRQQHFSELDHTYKTLHHTRSFESNTTLSCLNKAQFEFPIPADESNSFRSPSRILKSYGLAESMPYRPSLRNVVPFRRTISNHEPNRLNLPGEVDKATALAIIQSAPSHEFDPYNASQARPPVFRSTSLPNEAHELPGHSPSFEPQWSSRPLPYRREIHKFVDEEEAIAFARHRSEAKQRAKENARYMATPRTSCQNNTFNDRGGIPGKIPIPKYSGRSDIPPVPPVPADVKANQVDRRREEEDCFVRDFNFIDKGHSVSTDTALDTKPQFNYSSAALDKSRMPSERRILQDSRQTSGGSWKPYIDDWTMRREAAAMRQRSSNFTSAAPVKDLATLADAPVRQPVTTNSLGPSLALSSDQYLRPDPSSRSSSNLSGRPNLSDTSRPIPKTDCLLVDPSSPDFIPPTRSQTSVHLPLPSISRTPTPLNPCEVPPIGRYSGGLSYGFESKAGLGGSAGTRSSSGGLGGGDAFRKGQRLSQNFGVDLSDIPVIMNVKQA